MENIEKEFQKRGPWVTQFTISGKKYGGKISFDVEFIQVNPENTGLSTFGQFDGIFCFALSSL
ncbi:MAG: hypothetical protein IMF19_10780 [Proteobacteria bacterium]|nr:hypothetical protein [Pseudomonadota bacterium]